MKESQLRIIFYNISEGYSYLRHQVYNVMIVKTVNGKFDYNVACSRDVTCATLFSRFPFAFFRYEKNGFQNRVVTYFPSSWFIPLLKFGAVSWYCISNASLTFLWKLLFSIESVFVLFSQLIFYHNYDSDQPQHIAPIFDYRYIFYVLSI